MLSVMERSVSMAMADMLPDGNGGVDATPDAAALAVHDPRSGARALTWMTAAATSTVTTTMGTTGTTVTHTALALGAATSATATSAAWAAATAHRRSLFAAIATDGVVISRATSERRSWAWSSPAAALWTSSSLATCATSPRPPVASAAAGPSSAGGGGGLGLLNASARRPRARVERRFQVTSLAMFAPASAVSLVGFS